jgi:hypothetical protein
MGSKSRIADVNEAFGEADTMSIGDVLGKNMRKKAHKALDPLSEATPKKPRPSSMAAATPAKLVFTSALPTDTLGSRWQQQGKSRFYMESIQLTDSLIRRQLFGHGELRLSSRPKDYGKTQVYLGSRSLGDMNSTKEETYRIARALGAPSDSRVIANVDYHTIGLLPDMAAVNFANACARSFSAPEVERDLLKVSYSSLAEAVNFHATSVSAWFFYSICFFHHFCFLKIVSMISHFGL